MRSWVLETFWINFNYYQTSGHPKRRNFMFACNALQNVKSHRASLFRRGQANNCLRATQNSRLTLMDWWWRERQQDGRTRRRKNNTSRYMRCDVEQISPEFSPRTAPSLHLFTARWRKSLHRYYYFISWSQHKNSSWFSCTQSRCRRGVAQAGQQQNYCKSRRGKLLWCISKWRIVGGLLEENLTY